MYKRQQYIIDKTDGKGKVAVIAGNEGATQSDARRDGAKETFEDAGMEVVAVEQCDFDAQKAYDAAAAIIESNPDIVGIACGKDVYKRQGNILCGYHRYRAGIPGSHRALYL